VLEKWRAAAWAAGQQADPREARIARLHDLNQRLTSKLTRTHTEFSQLAERHRFLLNVLAAKDDELKRLRRELETFSPNIPGARLGTAAGVATGSADLSLLQGETGR